MQYYVKSGYQIFIHCFHFQKEFPAIRIIQVSTWQMRPDTETSKESFESAVAFLPSVRWKDRHRYLYGKYKATASGWLANPISSNNKWKLIKKTGLW